MPHVSSSASLKPSPSVSLSLRSQIPSLSRSAPSLAGSYVPFVQSSQLSPSVSLQTFALLSSVSSTSNDKSLSSSSSTPASHRPSKSKSAGTSPTSNGSVPHVSSSASLKPSHRPYRCRTQVGKTRPLINRIRAVVGRVVRAVRPVVRSCHRRCRCKRPRCCRPCRRTSNDKSLSSSSSTPASHRPSKSKSAGTSPISNGSRAARQLVRVTEAVAVRIAVTSGRKSRRLSRSAPSFDGS